MAKSQVTYVRNITDVDDKINARAARDFPGLPLNEAIRKVTEKTAAQFEADVKLLGCLPPTASSPRATENIDEMQTLIATLLQNGHAYEANGEVLFDTASMPDYGQLSRRVLEDNQAGARVAVDAHEKPGRFRAVEAVVGRGAGAGTVPGVAAGPAGTSSARR